MWDLIVSVPDHCLSFYFVLHDCKIVMLNCGQMIAFMENFVIKHTSSSICFITHFMFKLSKFPESPGIIDFL